MDVGILLICQSHEWLGWIDHGFWKMEVQFNFFCYSQCIGYRYDILFHLICIITFPNHCLTSRQLTRPINIWFITFANSYAINSFSMVDFLLLTSVTECGAGKRCAVVHCDTFLLFYSIESYRSDICKQPQQHRNSNEMY